MHQKPFNRANLSIKVSFGVILNKLKTIQQISGK